MVVYFDEHSTVNCPDGHNQPFHPGRFCKTCHKPIRDVAIRYRRMIQGNDHYFILYDSIPPPHLRDWLFGQTDRVEDLARYPDAHIIDGGFVSDAAYKAYTMDAMNDYAVSEFGLAAISGTTDR